MPAESFTSIVKRRTLGVAFIAVVVLFVALSIAIYNKAFTSTVDVTLKADHTGNQLQKYSDVKVDGLIVGSVESVSSNGGVASVKLHLDPGKVKQIPENVTAQILPKTLFGEQYVSLSIPNNASTTHIKAGDVIAQDRSKGALEAQTVLSDLYPLLTAVQPAQLNDTLTALATALHGRGDKLGQTLVNADKYLKILNGPASTGNTYTAQLADDLDKLGKVALEYNNVSPDLFSSLQNLLTSARTLVAKQQALDSLLTVGTNTSQTLEGFLAANKDRIIAVSGQTSKVFGVLNTYSPEFSCLFAGINKLYTEAGSAIYDGAIHLAAIVDVTKSSPGTTYGGYKNGEQPTLVTGYGPNCFGLPNNPSPVDSRGNFQIPSQFMCLNDGAWLTLAGSKGQCGGAKASSTSTTKPSTASTASASSAGSTALSSVAENAEINTLIAGQLGTTPQNVPATATLLAGPLLRGQKVVVK